MRYAVQVGFKFWCTGSDDDGATYHTLATPGMAGCETLTFVSYASAWRYGARKMDDEYGNKFKVVKLEQVENYDHDIDQIEKPKRRRKTKKAIRKQ